MRTLGIVEDRVIEAIRAGKRVAVVIGAEGTVDMTLPEDRWDVVAVVPAVGKSAHLNLRTRGYVVDLYAPQSIGFSGSDVLVSNTTIVSGRGFTLIELLVVIAIVAVLLAILAPHLAGSRAASRDGRCRVQLHDIAVSVAAFRADHPLGYPQSWGEMGYTIDGPRGVRDPGLVCPSDPTASPAISYTLVAPVVNINTIDSYSPSEWMVASDLFHFRHGLRRGETATPEYSEQWERSHRNKAYLDGSARPMMGPLSGDA